MTLAKPKLIPLVKPWLTEAEATAAFDVVMSGQVLQGPRVASFEASFSAYTGAPHALAVCNGTAAIILALMAAGVCAGDVVLTVSHSYIATANAVRACGAEPVLLDIEKDGFNIDCAQLEQVLESDCERHDGQLWYRDVARLAKFDQSPLHRISPPVGRVAAILAVHQIGIPCDIVRVCSIASQFNIPVIEDAACAVGSKICIDGQWEYIGRPRGAAATFSFHPRKMITTGDGGMITSANAQMHEHMRLLRQHGMAGIPGSGALSDAHPITGFNYRLTDIQAAIGELQLSRLDEQVARRRQLTDVYRANLKGQRRFAIQVEPENVYFNWQSLPVRFDPTRVRQGPLLDYLAGLGVMAKPGIMNAHQEPPYAGLWHLPNSERRKLDTIFVPLFHSMTEDDVARVSSALTAYQT
jgi:perosamine synthetase